MSSFKWSYTETHCSEPPRPQLVYICSYDLFIVFYIPLSLVASCIWVSNGLYNPLTKLLTNLMALVARGDSCRSQSPYNPQYSALVALMIKETYGTGSVKCWMLKIGNNHQFLSCQWFFLPCFLASCKCMGSSQEGNLDTVVFVPEVIAFFRSSLTYDVSVKPSLVIDQP